MANYSWEIHIKGFGPFSSSTNLGIGFKTSKVSIYAANGQGKTCLSRMFRSAELPSSGMPDSLVSNGTHTGEFSFRVMDDGQEVGSLSVNKSPGSPVSVNNSTDYLFHVFNSDYVRDNLDRKHYIPSGDIAGYILGKANIDVSNKKERLSHLGEEGSSLRKELDEKVASTKAELQQLGVNTRTKELSKITTDYIVNLDSRPDKYDDTLLALKSLQSIPEDNPSLGTVSFTHSRIDIAAIKVLLSHSYTRDEFADDFLDNMAAKRAFISEGIRIQDGETCPFCGRAYDDDAKNLIHCYEAYLAGKEAQTIALLDSAKSSLNSLKNDYSVFLLKHLSVKSRYNELRAAFPEYASTNLPDPPSTDAFSAIVDVLIEALNKKSGDISLVAETSSATELESALEHIDQTILETNQITTAIDNLLDKRSKTLRTTKKNLCIEACTKLRKDYAADIESLSELRKEYGKLKQEILDDESRSKRPKRAAVASLFSELLQKVFGDKYTFDEENFSITFQGSILGEDAEQVMSDGEKSVIAFCLYVASTFELLASETDSRRLFFVIDDPISSLDFHYVYGVIQIIRNLDALFNIKRVRLLILTHNTAFYNMLSRNKITAGHYILHDGKLTSYKGAGIIPYSEHLKDLHDVAEGKKPTHTTGNSIRQVLETLWHFDEPEADGLLDYLGKERCADLTACDYIYTLCQDQSHGASVFDSMQPIDEASIRNACQTVLQHIANHYPGQLSVSGVPFAHASTT